MTFTYIRIFSIAKKESKGKEKQFIPLLSAVRDLTPAGRFLLERFLLCPDKPPGEQGYLPAYRLRLQGQQKGLLSRLYQGIWKAGRRWWIENKDLYNYSWDSR